MWHTFSQVQNFTHSGHNTINYGIAATTTSGFQVRGLTATAQQEIAINNKLCMQTNVKFCIGNDSTLGVNGVKRRRYGKVAGKGEEIRGNW